MLEAINISKLRDKQSATRYTNCLNKLVCKYITEVEYNFLTETDYKVSILKPYKLLKK